MVSFFWKKSPVVFLNDIPCRNILLSLHFQYSDFWDRSSRYHSWRVITKKYRVSFCETALFFDLDDRLFKSIFLIQNCLNMIHLVIKKRLKSRFNYHHSVKLISI